MGPPNRGVDVVVVAPLGVRVVEVGAIYVLFLLLWEYVMVPPLFFWSIRTQ